MLNAKQIEALKKLAVAPAVRNSSGVAKNSDNTTLNGNMARNLIEKGLVEKKIVGTHQIWVRDIQQYRTATIESYNITEAGKAAL